MLSSRASSNRWLNENVSSSVHALVERMTRHPVNGSRAARSADVCLDTDGPFIDVSESSMKRLSVVNRDVGDSVNVLKRAHPTSCDQQHASCVTLLFAFQWQPAVAAHGAMRRGRGAISPTALTCGHDSDRARVPGCRLTPRQGDDLCDGGRLAALPKVGLIAPQRKQDPRQP